MIDYTKYKRFYTSGDQFKLADSNYIGYVEVINGVPFVSRDIIYSLVASQSAVYELSYNTDFETLLLLSEFSIDRRITDDTVLPYSLSDMLFEANDLLNYDLLQARVDKIKSNNLYVYSRCLVPKNQLPTSAAVKYAGVASPRKGQLDILTSFIDTPVFASTFNFNGLANIKGFDVFGNIDSNDVFVVVAYTETQLIIISCSDATVKVEESSSSYDTSDITNELVFTSIGGMAIAGNKLFVSDTEGNAVIKYDLTTYVGVQDVVHRRRLEDVLASTDRVGGSKSAVKRPTLLAASSKLLAVYSSGDFAIKMYDINFNFKSIIRSISFKQESVQALEINKLTERMYVCTKTKFDKYKLYVYNDNLTLGATYELDIALLASEVVNSIRFSYSDSNYFYITTNFNIYKLLVSRPDQLLGKFDSSKLFTNTQVSEEGAPIFEVATEVTYFENVTTTSQVSAGAITSTIQTVSSVVTSLSSTTAYVSIPVETQQLVQISTSTTNDIWNYIGINHGSSDFLWNTGLITTSTTESLISEIVYVDTPVTIFTTVSSISLSSNINTTVTTAISTGTVRLSSIAFTQQLSSSFVDTYISTLFNDSFKSFSILPQSDNTDKLIFITKGKIYFFNELNEYNSVLKYNNIANYGATFNLDSDEYVQGSTINKEFHKVTRDIISLKNNIVGRFTGKYDASNSFIYTDYNYNIDMSNFIDGSIEDFLIHDNEKNTLGVFNRVITQIYKLQENLIELTKADRGDDVSPVFNVGQGYPSNVLIIE